MKRERLLLEITEGMGLMRRKMAHAHSVSRSQPTHAQTAIIFILGHGGGLTLKQVAARMCVSSSAATQLIDGLVREKLIVRTEDAEDRRKTRLSLSPRGERQLRKIKKTYVAAFAKALSPLSDAELAQWRDLQKKIIAHLK